MCFTVNGQMQLTPYTTAFWPCFLTFHSPSPKTFSPVEQHHGDFTSVTRFETTLTDFARLLTLV
jgi:hypothetical protein